MFMFGNAVDAVLDTGAVPGLPPSPSAASGVSRLSDFLPGAPLRELAKSGIGDFTGLRAQSAERRAQSAERRAQSAERRAQSAERRAQSAERRAQSAERLTCVLHRAVAALLPLAFALFAGLAPAEAEAQTGPSLVRAVVNGATLTLTYDQDLDSGSVPNSGNSGPYWVRVGDAEHRHEVTAVAVAGRTVTLTLASAVTAGEAVSVSYTPDTAHSPGDPVQNLGGTDAARFLRRAVTNVTGDATAPSLRTALVKGAALTLTWSETLDDTSVPATNAFSVSVGGATRTVSTVAVSGRTVTLTLASAVTGGQTVTVGYDDSLRTRLRDLAGNNAASFTGQSVFNGTGDNLRPTLSSAAVNGVRLVLTYSEALDTASVPGTGAFAVTVGSNPRSVSGVSVSGMAVTLTPAHRGGRRRHGDAELHRALLEPDPRPRRQPRPEL